MATDDAKIEELSRLASQLKGYFWSEIKGRLRHRHFRGPLTCRLNVVNTLRFFATWQLVLPSLKRGSADAIKRLKMPSETLSSHMDCYDSGDRCGDTYAAFRFKETVNELLASEPCKELVQ